LNFTVSRSAGTAGDTCSRASPRARALVAALGRERCTLVGHDWGAPIADEVRDALINFLPRTP
jgi:hypothetical protein